MRLEFCEFCPVVKGIRCAVCGRVTQRTNDTITIGTTEVQQDGGSVRYQPRANRYAPHHSQRCGGGRRVIKKRIGD